VFTAERAWSSEIPVFSVMRLISSSMGKDSSLTL
jgi:hypothetical protein